MKKLKSLFQSTSGPGANGRPEPFPWQPLDSRETLQLLRESRQKPVVIFKHSTRCGLSGMMLRRFQQNWEKAREGADFYLLDLVRHRELSDEVARILEVPHQSPQVLIVENGSVLDCDSHGGIDRLRPEPESKDPA